MNIRGGIKYSVLVAVVFFLGWISSVAYSYYDYNEERPFSYNSNELKSPGNWIRQDQIIGVDIHIGQERQEELVAVLGMMSIHQINMI